MEPPEAVASRKKACRKSSVFRRRWKPLLHCQIQNICLNCTCPAVKRQRSSCDKIIFIVHIMVNAEDAAGAHTPHVPIIDRLCFLLLNIRFSSSLSLLRKSHWDLCKQTSKILSQEQWFLMSPDHELYPRRHPEGMGSLFSL